MERSQAAGGQGGPPGSGAHAPETRLGAAGTWWAGLQPLDVAISACQLSNSPAAVCERGTVGVAELSGEGFGSPTLRQLLTLIRLIKACGMLEGCIGHWRHGHLARDTRRSGRRAARVAGRARFGRSAQGCSRSPLWPPSASHVDPAAQDALQCALPQKPHEVSFRRSAARPPRAASHGDRQRRGAGRRADRPADRRGGAQEAEQHSRCRCRRRPARGAAAGGGHRGVAPPPARHRDPPPR